MAKPSKKRKQQRNNNRSKKRKLDSSTTSSASLKNSTHRDSNPHPGSSSFSKANVPLPLPFPHAPDLPVPEKDFLRNIQPYKRTFRTAIESSYEGFTVDKPDGEMESFFDHDKIQRALLTIDQRGLFRTDVTQPFGLGTKCAKTYVTRCLLGDEGTTYKYLGLRMFAHPWNSSSKPKDEDATIELNESLNVISKLNKDLIDRTKSHLDDLEQTRRKRNFAPPSIPCIKGRAMYDVALINRMTNAPDLKREPTLGQGKCSVSWHADSSLEHYSSIAVYHTIVSDAVSAETRSGKFDSSIGGGGMHQENNDMATKWSIALRCAHHSEGPGASRRGKNIESSVIVDTPPVAVSLPSRSAYYLLDDFNHHHQHAVLVDDGERGAFNVKEPASAGVRFASTHRLLREGHNVNFILERCRITCSQFHRKGPKIFRSEQLLLTEIETEWIRQFYIQGEGHKRNLWKYWEEPICQLLKYWEKLEKRTKQVIDLLQNAAIARCNNNGNLSSGHLVLNRAERKQKEKQKKALSALEDLLKRGSDNASNGNPSELLYLPMCNMLEERAKMRSLWLERENERVFKTMDSEYWPLPVPFQFNVTEGQTSIKESGFSPLDGTAEELLRISGSLKKFGDAIISQNALHLPGDYDLKSEAVSKAVEPTHDQKLLSKLKSTTSKSISQTDFLKAEKGKNEGLLQVTESCSKAMIDQKELSDEVSNDYVMSRPKTSPLDHKKDLTWKRWSSINVGLEMQKPWARLLLDGVKTIETRAYDLPRSLIGKKIDILESKGGVDCVSGLSNVMIGEEIHNCVKRIGWAIFDKVIVYRYKAKFLADEKKHCVKPDSNYAWNDNTTLIYGWVVSKCGTYGKRSKRKVVKCLYRRMRSLFEMQT